MKLVHIERALPSDIEGLLRLYTLIYGRSYPHAFGTDPEVAKATLESKNHFWFVARAGTGALVGSVVFDTDPLNRIGKLAGLVVHPDFRRAGIAVDLVRSGTEILFCNYWAFD